MLSNIIKINSKKNLINNYYSILILTFKNIKKNTSDHDQILPLEHRDAVVSARNDPFGNNKISHMTH